jgi:iron complex outermembrane recepter protein
MRLSGLRASSGVRVSGGRRTRILLTAGCLVAGLHCGVLPTRASAQEANPTGQKSTGAPVDSDQLAEIVVTAQFRRQDIQQTPLAISAITADMMAAQGERNVMDVAARVPGVTFNAGSLGGSQASEVSIRGIGQTDFNLAVEPGVGVYIDDVYYGTVYGSLLDLLDLDRVEVLRGPQGTLAGKNSEGGAIKLFTKQPSDQDGGYVEASGGSFNRREVRAGANWAVIPDKLSIRVSGLGEKSDGYVKRYDYQCFTGNPPIINFQPGSIGPFSPGATSLNFVPGSVGQGGRGGCEIGNDGAVDVTAFRVALRYDVNEQLHDTLAYDTTRDRSGPPASVLLAQGQIFGPGYNLLAGSPNLAASFVAPRGSYYNFATYTGLAGTPGAYAFDPTNSLDAWGVANTFVANLGGGLTLSSISSVRDLVQSSTVDSTPSPLSLAINHWVVDYRQYTQELRLSGNFNRFNWTVGGFYFDSNALQGGRIALDGATASPSGVPFFVPLDFLFNDPVHANSKAGFGHLEYQASDALTFTGGVRYTTDYKRYVYSRSAPLGFENAESPAAASTGIETGITSLNLSAPPFRGKRFDYSATADYKVTNDVHAYLAFATGFKGGGVNPRPYYAEQVRTFAPETVDSYEFGIKSDLLDNHVRLNADVFYEKYKDMQLTLFSCPQFVPPGAPPNCYLPANVGTANIKGAELEAEVHALHGLTFNGSASYIEFHYETVDPAALIPLDSKAPFTPKFKLTAGMQYATRLGDAGSLTPRIDWLYVAEQYASAQNAPLNRIAPYGVTNVRLMYRDSKDTWEVALEGRNVFDKYYFVNLNGGNLASDPSQTQTGYPAPPREYAITLKRKF